MLFLIRPALTKRVTLTSRILGTEALEKEGRWTSGINCDSNSPVSVIGMSQEVQIKRTSPDPSIALNDALDPSTTHACMSHGLHPRVESGDGQQSWWVEVGVGVENAEEWFAEGKEMSGGGFFWTDCINRVELSSMSVWNVGRKENVNRVSKHRPYRLHIFYYESLIYGQFVGRREWDRQTDRQTETVCCQK